MVVAAVITVRRRRSGLGTVATGRVLQVYLVGIVAQAIHATEEYATGFYERFPILLGLAPWPAGFFIAFNLGWIGIWVLAAFAVRRGLGIALFPLWFFALAACVNLIVHPLLSLRVGGYFPGLVSAPLVGIFGIALWHRLSRLTALP
jgi:hypothetical protein